MFQDSLQDKKRNASHALVPRIYKKSISTKNAIKVSTCGNSKRRWTGY